MPKYNQCRIKHIYADFFVVYKHFSRHFGHHFKIPYDLNMSTGIFALIFVEKESLEANEVNADFGTCSIF